MLVDMDQDTMRIGFAGVVNGVHVRFRVSASTRQLWLTKHGTQTLDQVRERCGDLALEPLRRANARAGELWFADFFEDGAIKLTLARRSPDAAP